MQDRLQDPDRGPDGAAVPGPNLRWVGRRHGRRQDRRWAASWSPEQVANRLRVDFPEGPCGYRTKPFTRRSTFRDAVLYVGS